MSVGPGEILVILIVALIVFGPKRLPEVGRQVGAVLRELRRVQESMRSELDTMLHGDHPETDARPALEEPDHTELPPPPPPPDDGFAGPPTGSFT